MNTPHSPRPHAFHRLALLLAVAAALAPVHAGAAERLAGVAANGRLVLFPSDDPGNVTVMQVHGLQPGEEILGIDVRPATGELYALGSSSRLYTLDLSEGSAVATPVGSTPFATALQGTRFGFDFNPTVDRIRIVSDAGQNLRAHPVTGAVAAVDSPLAYLPGDPGYGHAPAVAGAAYINNDNDPATGTTLFNIDVARHTLVIQNPPNAGGLMTVGPLGIEITGEVGLDVAGSDGTVYASLIEAGRPGQSARAGLYTLDLLSGAATFVGPIGGPKPLTSLTALGPIE